jgi:putative oxidoreductase
MNLSKNDFSKFILRVFFSAFMMTHGYPKLMKIVNGNTKFANPIGLGSEISLYLTVFSEFFAPLLIIIGYKTRFFSFFPAFTMVIAAFVIHGDDPFKKMEMALLFLVAYIVIMISGPGKISIDYFKSR